MAPGPIMTFVPSTNLERARTYYDDVVGLTFVELTPFACVFASGDVMLRVTKVDELRAQPFTVLGWEVADIAAEVARLQERGVEFLVFEGFGQDADGVWTAPGGAKIAWFHDPDGNTLSLTQF
ncbi:VOC family protein [Streptosporangiaceae bacterium NEAU-GS5]|nr:VOC family protein [Streptosporangiaceae bacterium NEAU-GS5]